MIVLIYIWYITNFPGDEIQDSYAEQGNLLLDKLFSYHLARVSKIGLEEIQSCWVFRL